MRIEDCARETERFRKPFVALLSPPAGTATPVGPIGYDAGGLDTDFDGTTDSLYSAGFNNSTGHIELRLIDTSTGASTFVSGLPFDQIIGFAIENAAVCAP